MGTQLERAVNWIVEAASEGFQRGLRRMQKGSATRTLLVLPMVGKEPDFKWVASLHPHYDAAQLKAIWSARALELKRHQYFHCVIPHAPSLCWIVLGQETLKTQDWRESFKKIWTLVAGQPHLESVYYFARSAQFVEGSSVLEAAVAQWTQAHEEVTYVFDEFKSKPHGGVSALKKAVWVTETMQGQRAVESVIREQLALYRGIRWLKRWANRPPNHCSPADLAAAALQLSKQYPNQVKVRVFKGKELEKLRMGGLLGVGQGSELPPHFIVVEYKPKHPPKRRTGKGHGPIVLVGKGITFDTGGQSLKPASSMVNMKYDMTGAATVFGLIAALAEANWPVEVVGLVPAAENMPGGKAIRPDDVLTTRSGLTVEVLNTDAEGRLVLCDALDYAKQYSPSLVIDVATLTGACVVALGKVAAGVFSNQRELARAFVESGLASGDKCWELPLWDDYQDLLASSTADFANVGGSEGGSIVAACFLSRFVGSDYPWVHLDIAGVAYKGQPKDRGATGRPLPLLWHYLKRRVLQG